MTYYLVILVYMFLVQYLARNVKEKEVLIMALTFLPLFLYGAMRVNCGDYEIYEQYNNWIRESNTDITLVIERMEHGYAFLNKLLPYRWIIVLTSLLACYAYGVLFVKIIPQKFRWFCILLFFIEADKTFYFMFASIRNSIAMSILLLYLTYRICRIEKRYKMHSISELLFFSAITIGAYYIHASAILFFPIAYFATTNKSFSDVEFLIWIFVLVFLWVIPVERLIENNIFQSDFFSRYDEYIEETRNAGVLARIGATIFALLCLFEIRDGNQLPKKMIISRLMLLYVYSYMLGSINMRVSYYFIPYAIVFLSLVFVNNHKNALTTLLLVYAFIFFFYSSFIAGSFASATHSPFVIYKIAGF